MVEVNNLTANRADKKLLKKIAEKVLAGENKKIGLSIALVGQARIKELNKKYRRKDKATDVLSFQYDNSGEVVICLKEVKKNAEEFKSTFKKELARILIHGILHVLGYTHQTMKNKENHYFKLFQQWPK